MREMSSIGNLPYDPKGLLLAIVVGMIGGYLFACFTPRARDEGRSDRLWWVLLAGIAAGATVWATNMLMVLALAGGRGGRYGEHVYDGATVALVMLGCVTVGIGLAALGTLTRRYRFSVVASGLLGVLVVEAHYGAVASIRGAGSFVWNVPLAIALEAASCLGLGALSLFKRKRGRSGGDPLFLALLALYVTMVVSGAAMTVEFVPDPAARAPVHGLGHGTLTLFLTGVIGVLTAGGLAIASIDRLAFQDAQARLRRLALHDALTGLPNRPQLMDELERLVRAGRPFALVGIDLDRFKPVNDVHGHAAGDAMLHAAAKAASATLRSGEFLARIGGDEFVAIRSQPDEGGAEAFARRLVEAIRRPVDWNGAQLSVGASAGVALHPRDGADAGALLRSMDLALYRAKEDGGDAVRLYDPAMDEGRRGRSALAMELRQALVREEFELHFQPQTELESGLPVGFEALIRWRHPRRGLVRPDEFIPIAESTGLIRDIGAWVLHAACREASRWAAPLPVAVNVAPQQLVQHDFVEIVRDALLGADLPASRLELEITEASVIADQARARQVMEALKTLGVRIAMDDYGTGYASLATLRGFPFDRIKIDRSFIDGVTEDPQSIAIVRSTLLLGRALSIPVLAEGVSAEAEREFLRREGCLQGQGYLFGRPAPAEEVRRMIEAFVASAPRAAEA